MLIKLNWVRDYSEIGSKGKAYIFGVNDHKRIKIDTADDNSIESVWFHDDRADHIVAYFTVVGLVYIENLMSGVYLDVDKLREYDHMFKEEG